MAKVHIFTHTVIEDDTEQIYERVSEHICRQREQAEIVAMVTHHGELPDYDYVPAASSPLWAFPESLEDQKRLPADHICKLVADGISIAHEIGKGNYS